MHDPDTGYAPHGGTARQDSPVSMVAIGASAGGIDAVRCILGHLSREFPAPILLAHHRAADPISVYMEVLQASTSLRVHCAQEDEHAEGGTLYFAPPGRHLLLRSDGTFCTCLHQRLRSVRPSVDLLFDSIAASHGAQCMGVILSGMGDDGTRGARRIRAAGGLVLAQDEATSQHFDMPRAAIEERRVDLVLPIDAIAFAMQVLTGDETAHAV